MGVNEKSRDQIPQFCITDPISFFDFTTKNHFRQAFFCFRVFFAKNALLFRITYGKMNLYAGFVPAFKKQKARIFYGDPF